MKLVTKELLIMWRDAFASIANAVLDLDDYLNPNGLSLQTTVHDAISSIGAIIGNHDAPAPSEQKDDPIIGWKWEVIPDSDADKRKGPREGVYWFNPADFGIDVQSEQSRANYKWTAVRGCELPPAPAPDIIPEEREALEQAICQASVAAIAEASEVDRLKILLEECKSDWAGAITQLKAEHSHEVEAFRKTIKLLVSQVLRTTTEIITLKASRLVFPDLFKNTMGGV